MSHVEEKKRTIEKKELDQTEEKEDVGSEKGRKANPRGNKQEKHCKLKQFNEKRKEGMVKKKKTRIRNARRKRKAKKKKTR